MLDLSKLTQLAALFVGPSILALLILAIGAFGARRRSSVFAVAGLAALCVLAHATLLYFVSGMGRAWGGSGKDGLLLGAGIAVLLLAVLAIALFVQHKLARAESTDPADTVRGAAIVIAVFLLVYIGSSLLRTDPLFAPLLRPRFWLVVAIGGLASWGLWRHRRWAWWLGGAAAAWELFRFVNNPEHDMSIAMHLGLSVNGFMALLQVTVLALLLRKNARTSMLGKPRR